MKVSVNKTFAHVQEQKSDVAATFHLNSTKIYFQYLWFILVSVETNPH